MEKKQKLDQQHEDPRSQEWHVLFAVLVVGQVLVEMGLNISLHSITIIQVPADADRVLNDTELNWTIAATALAALAGCLLATATAPALGARRLLLATQPVYALAALMVGLGDRFAWVLAGRVLMTAALGAAEGTARGYAMEVAPPARRALYTAVLNVLGFVSSAAGLLVAPLLHWRTLFLVAGFAPAAVCLAGLGLIPSSAKWLLSRGHSEQDARRAIRFFRGWQFDADAEIAGIRASLRHGREDDGSVAPWRLLLRRDTLRPLLLVAVQLFLFIWTGGMAVSGITSYILAPVRLDLSDYHSAALPTAVAAVFIVPGSLVVDRFGRLPLLRAGGALSAAGCVAIAAFFYLPDALRDRLGWLVLAGAVTTQLAHACIISPVAFTYISELLPNRTRTMAANITMGFMYMNLFLLLKLYPLLRDSLGFGGTFVMHAVVSVLQVVFATLCLPETRGLSLERIQHLFEDAESVVEESMHTGDAEQAKKGEVNPALDVDCMGDV